MTDRALSLMLYGPPRGGKSTVATTAPAPRLILDVEASSRFLPGKKIYWNPLTEAPPVYVEEEWETCIVAVTEVDIALKAYDWLKSGQHPFKSVILDSISEFQVKLQEAVNGRARMKIQDWGEMYSRLSFFGRDLRDLTHLPNTKIEAVVVIAMDHVNEQDGSHRPLLQGQVKSVLPYWYDINGYFYSKEMPDPETGEPTTVRCLFTGDHPQFVAGCRPRGIPPEIINPNIEEMIEQIFGPKPE